MNDSSNWEVLTPLLGCFVVWCFGFFFFLFVCGSCSLVKIQTYLVLAFALPNFPLICLLGLR